MQSRVDSAKRLSLANSILQGVTVFVSYSQKDDAWAARIQDALEREGVRVWRDKSRLIAGHDIQDSLSSAISDVNYFVLLVSKHSASSNWVKKELNTALAHEKENDRRLLIPVRLDNATLPEVLSERHCLDFTEMLAPRALRQLVDHLKKVALDDTDLRCKQKKYITTVDEEGFFIGIDVGTTKIATALISLSKNGFVIEYERKIRHTAIGFEKETSLLDKILSQINEARKAKRLCAEEIGGIGIGLPGQVDEECGWLIFAPGLQQRNVDVVARLRSKLPGSNIYIDNDVNCATLAEQRFGRGQKLQNFICVFVGTGVGAGVVINGRLHRGKHCAAGEIGHMRINMTDKALSCNCGRCGCLEEYASARAITRMSKERIKAVESCEDVTPEMFIELVRKNNKEAIQIATEFASNLSIGLGNAVDVLNPEAVVLGGGIIEALMDFDFFRNALKIGFDNNVLSIVKDTPLLEASYGNKSGMIGAAVLAQINASHLSD